jgi:hypothetical protein
VDDAHEQRALVAGLVLRGGTGVMFLLFSMVNGAGGTLLDGRSRAP